MSDLVGKPEDHFFSHRDLLQLQDEDKFSHPIFYALPFLLLPSAGASGLISLSSLINSLLVSTTYLSTRASRRARKLSVRLWIAPAN